MSQQGQLKTRDGLTLATRRWMPVDAHRGDLVLLHGYAEHCGRYDHVAAAMNQIGLAVHAYDQRGHGLSPGRRGYIHRYDVWVDDLEDFIASLRDEVGDKPLFLMGHSMGGQILCRYVQTREVEARGLVFSSPFLALTDDVPPALIALASVLSVVTPWLPVGRVEADGVARDPEVVQAYEADPLIYHGRVLARTGAEFNRAIQDAHEAFDRVTQPMFVMHGRADPVVPYHGSEQLYKQSDSPDKTWRLYPDGYHELLNDTDKDQVLAELCEWLNGRLAG